MMKKIKYDLHVYFTYIVHVPIIKTVSIGTYCKQQIKLTELINMRISNYLEVS